MSERALRYRIGDGAWQECREGGCIDAPRGVAARFDLASGGHWYGHGFAHRQPWPLEAEPVVNDAFAVNNCQSPIWMCSAGFALLAETTAGLSVRCNADDGGQLVVRCDGEPLSLQVFRGADLRDAVRQLLAHLGWPNPCPDPSLLGDSIFCTWTQYPRCITQERVLAMARAIREQGYPCSTITIDDRWESAFGELTFSDDFPDPTAMMRDVHDLGFRVLLWVTPFINEEARTFAPLERDGLLVRAGNGGAARLKWWGGTAGLVDLTLPAGREWYRSQVLRLKALGIDGFKIDGGDGKYQPPRATSRWHRDPGPSGYSDELLAVFEKIAPGLCETRTMWLSQRRNILWRQGGKDSHWGIDNGLTAMVHLGLHMALMGYDILIPDMIPGRVQTMVSDMPLPTDELMVRWTETSALMPIMQFSYFPWNYAPETAAVCHAFAHVHKALEPYLAAHATERRDPLLRPVWYAAPECDALYTIGDELMLGPDLLAAPVLGEGRTTRDVILPPGEWRDAWTGAACEGTLLDHPAPCPGMPIFVRMENRKLFERLHPLLAAIPRGTIRHGTTTATYQAGLDRDLAVTG
jgi:myogenesis-regulating glycosidase